MDEKRHPGPEEMQQVIDGYDRRVTRARNALYAAGVPEVAHDNGKACGRFLDLDERIALLAAERDAHRRAAAGTPHGLGRAAVDADVGRLAREHLTLTVTVRTRGLGQFRFRLWLLRRVLDLAAWVAPAPLRVEEDDTPTGPESA